jgi:hypothetical protein
VGGIPEGGGHQENESKYTGDDCKESIQTNKSLHRFSSNWVMSSFTGGKDRGRHHIKWPDPSEKDFVPPERCISIPAKVSAILQPQAHQNSLQTARTLDRIEDAVDGSPRVRSTQFIRLAMLDKMSKMSTIMKCILPQKRKLTPPHCGPFPYGVSVVIVCE